MTLQATSHLYIIPSVLQETQSYKARKNDIHLTKEVDEEAQNWYGNSNVHIELNFFSSFFFQYNAVLIFAHHCVVPSQHVRDLIEDYNDDIAFGQTLGNAEIMITLGFNTRWPEFQDGISNIDNNPVDMMKFCYKIFKTKLDDLLDVMSTHSIFEHLSICYWRVCFDDNGMPHAYIISKKDDSFFTEEEVNNIIVAEIPDKNLNPELYEIVKEFMIKEVNGSQEFCFYELGDKIWPKPFVYETTIDDENNWIYQRRDDKKQIMKKNEIYSNGHVIPYNPCLLLKYNTYMNVEIFPKIRYFCVVREIFNRLSRSENYIQVWKNLGYRMANRTMEIVKLPYHLPFDHSKVENNPIITKFLAWMECNKLYSEARALTYCQFPTKFEWNAPRLKWIRRKNDIALGRLLQTHKSSGEIYYLRLLLNVVKGPICYEDIRSYNGIVMKTFKEACISNGLIDNDDWV